MNESSAIAKYEEPSRGMCSFTAKGGRVHGAKGLAALAGVSCNCVVGRIFFFIAGRPSSAVVVVAEPPPLQTLCMD